VREARPVRIDTDARSGKRSAVAAAWRRIEALRARGYTVDHGGRWTYHAFDDWIGASHGYGWRREPIDGPVDYARELQLARYVATGR
jgi:hypothetical protein